MIARAARLTIATTLCAGLAACGGDSLRFGGSGGGRNSNTEPTALAGDGERAESTIWDLFGNRENPNYTVGVNKYLWNASLDVLNFLPIQSVDPYTGVIVTGYGTPPGGGRSYRATIKISDPALDARSLKLALQGSGGGAVEPGTVRAVEDAILTRARQLRQQDAKL
ncbi:DUF3576 domain-containing protein [uncultured Paracoccus sp.]|uniref:DUF3576 domain-containing protein n=1 Tax=uncultured Paracoccus sp. TaxID=189685 RepID=UPI002617B9A4|nr:DUF3576 domain-containing protein [uncultured Paracoccus sp.]